MGLKKVGSPTRYGARSPSPHDALGWASDRRMGMEGYLASPTAEGTSWVEPLRRGYPVEVGRALRACSARAMGAAIPWRTVQPRTDSVR